MVTGVSGRAPRQWHHIKMVSSEPSISKEFILWRLVDKLKQVGLKEIMAVHLETASETDLLDKVDSLLPHMAVVAAVLRMDQQVLLR